MLQLDTSFSIKQSSNSERKRKRASERAHTVRKNVNTSSVSKHYAIEFVALNRQFVGVSCALSKTVIRLKINHLHRIINDIHDKKLENPTEYYAVILLLCKFENACGVVAISTNQSF